MAAYKKLVFFSVTSARFLKKQCKFISELMQTIINMIQSWYSKQNDSSYNSIKNINNELAKDILGLLIESNVELKKRSPSVEVQTVPVASIYRNHKGNVLVAHCIFWDYQIAILKRKNVFGQMKLRAKSSPNQHF